MIKWNFNKTLITTGLLLIVALSLLSDQRQPPRLTWHHSDKEAFGGYVLHQLLPAFGQEQVQSKYVSLFETMEQDTLPPGNLLLLGNSITMDEEDWQALEQHVAAGNTAIMAAHRFSALLEDSLNLRISFYNTDWSNLNDPFTLFEKKVNVSFKNLPNFPKQAFEISGQAGMYQLSSSKSDTAIYPYTTLATNDKGYEVLRSYAIGQGQLLVSSTPMLFSNYFLMEKDLRPFTSGLLSLLPPAERAWHYEYYHLGRLESSSPTRFVLSQPALKAAFYLMLAGIVLFFIFGSKRRQRAIPVINPPQNHSLEFVKTLASLHYRTHSHGGILRKRMAYFQDYVLRHYRIRLSEGEGALKELQAKSRARKELIERLYTIVSRDFAAIGEDALQRLDKDLDEFYKTT